MARFNTFYNRYFCFTFISLVCSMTVLCAQGNCLIYPEDSGERKACELSYKAIEFEQGSKESQLLFDEAIKVAPKYAYSHYQKSVPFFKLGLFAEGMAILKPAVEIEPLTYLSYRAFWYFYNRSYDFCIKDLEELYTVHKASYTFTPGGDMEVRLLLAMAHAQTGNIQKGIDWMLNLMDSHKKQPHLIGYYDYFCLGVLYYKNGQLDLAESEFEKQLTIDADFADTYYYLGLIKEKESNKKLAERYFKQALARMNKENGGYSINLFTGYNTSREDVEIMLQN